MLVLFERATARAFFRAYAAEVEVLAKARDIDPAKCYISGRALDCVLREVKKDCLIFQERRPLGHGISKGKIAGSMVFRLCRTQTLFFHPSIIENSDALQLPINAALALGLDIMGIKFSDIDRFIVRELKYFLAKRHINQESLGICFDVMTCKMAKA